MTTRPAMTAVGLIFALGLSVGTSGGVAAQDGIDDWQVFNRIDTDDNGVIDAEEVRAGSETWFLAYDADGDGVVTRDEMADQSAPSARLVLADLDQDGDGTISREEFLGAERGYYDERVGEGELTTRDYAEMVEERDDALVPDVDDDGMISEDEAAADWERSFFALDLDDDGQISEEEWFGSAEAGPGYADLDADQDAAISRAEYLAFGKQAFYDTRAASDADQLTAADYAESIGWRDDADVVNVDTDGDGKISAAEYAADAERWFGSFDRDRNGILTAPEYDPSQAAIRDITDTFAASGDADVVISRDDFVAFRERELEQADLDGDGEVSVWEYRSFRQN